MFEVISRHIVVVIETWNKKNVYEEESNWDIHKLSTLEVLNKSLLGQ
jgi:hypothetical protein